jgi:hypothetical protein
MVENNMDLKEIGRKDVEWTDLVKGSDEGGVF